MIEIIVALVLLLITMLPLGYLVTNEVHQAASAKDRLAALAVGEKWVEILSTAQDPPPSLQFLGVDTDKPLIPKLPTGVSVPTEVRGGTTFTIRSEYTWTTVQDPHLIPIPNLCTSGGAQVLNLQVTVTWGRNVSAIQHITSTTVLNYPAPGIPQYGFYQLQMAGATGTPDQSNNPWSTSPPGVGRVQSIPVTFTPSSGTGVTIYPDQYGCIFAELLPGTYTVTVNNPAPGTPPNTNYGNPSFVENLGTDGSAIEPTGPVSTPIVVANANPVTITAGVTTPLTTLPYDEGSNVVLGYPTSTSTEDGVICPGTGQITCVSEGEGTPSSLGGTPAAASLALTSGSSWSSAVLPSSPTSTRIAAEACATAACIGVGYGYTGSTPHGMIVSNKTANSPGTATLDTLPAGVTGLTNVACPTSTACVAWGNGTTGPVVLAGQILSTGDTWNAEGLPAGMTTVNQVACSPALNCVAVGSGGLFGWSASGPLYGSSGAPSAGPWGGSLVAITLPEVIAPTNITQVACPTTTDCMAVGVGRILGVGPIVPVVMSGLQISSLPGVATVPVWTFDAYPLLPALAPLPTSLTQLVCPPTTNTCLVVGTGVVGGTAQAVIYSGTVTTLFLVLDSVPSTTKSLSQLVCPSATVCVAIGTGITAPAILSGVVGTTDTWSLQASSGGLPTGTTSLSAVTCPVATVCAIAATNNATGTSEAAILSGAPGTSAMWSGASLPAADASALYLTGISCVPGSATSTCSAVGASPSSGVIMMSTNGPSGTWGDHSSDPLLTLRGSPTSNIPIELTNGQLINSNSNITGAWNPVPGTALGRANVTLISDIFPFTSGYGLFAGDCKTEGPPSVSTAAATLLNTVPGNTSMTPGATIPLGILSIQLNSSAGAPESGSALVLTAANASCPADKYNLQSTGPDGLSRTEIPFGAYSLALPTGSPTNPVTLTVAPGAVTVGATTYLLPQPVPLVGP